MEPWCWERLETDAGEQGVSVRNWSVSAACTQLGAQNSRTRPPALSIKLGENESLLTAPPPLALVFIQFHQVHGELGGWGTLSSQSISLLVTILCGDVE